MFNALLVLAFLVLFLAFALEKNWVVFLAFLIVSCSFLIDLILGVWLGCFSGMLRPVYDGIKIERATRARGFWTSAVCRGILAVGWIAIGIAKCFADPIFT